MISGHVAGQGIEGSRGGFRAFYQWLTGSAPVAVSSSGPNDPTGEVAMDRPAAGEPMPDRIGHYRIDRKLGEGGMGVVYAARDERLERTVALKTMSAPAADETARKRFWREARAAASVNHPNVCQIYEIGEDAGELFIAMELLEGEPLSDRLERGAAERRPRRCRSASACWRRWRRCTRAASSIAISSRRTCSSRRTASSCSTSAWRGPNWPERRPAVDGADARPASSWARRATWRPSRSPASRSTPRSDLFAAGAILFEMLAGRPAFAGRTDRRDPARDHATSSRRRSTGSPAVAAVDRVIRRALAKRPADRPASADAMADELRAVRGIDSGRRRALAHALTRLVVLPFRVLRPDPETDFLAFSLPDAITTSLVGHRLAGRAIERRRRRASPARRRTSRRSPPRPTSIAW